MKNLDLNIRVLNEFLVEGLFRNEKEIRTTAKCFDFSTEVDEILENEFHKAKIKYGISEGFFPDHYYNQLYVLKKERSNLEINLLIEFLKLFPHRRESMSLNYISKQLGISLEALFIWFHFESISIIKKKHGRYVDCEQFMKFMNKISRKNYRIGKNILSNNKPVLTNLTVRF